VVGLLKANAPHQTEPNELSPNSNIVVMAERLLAEGVCATAMEGWGEQYGRQYIRFVFSNEPIERLRRVSNKVRSVLRIG